MPLSHNFLIDQLLVPATFLFFLVAGIAGTVLGLALIVFRGRISGLFRPMNHWVSARKSLEPLDRPHNIAPVVYRYRRWFSAVFIVGAAFSIVMLVAKVDVRAVVSLLGADPHSVVGSWVAASLGWLLIAGSVLAIAIGIVLGFFPQVLAAIETRANRWYSPRQIGRGADVMYLTLDRWVEYSPRTAGSIIAIAALVVAFNSAFVLLGRG